MFFVRSASSRRFRAGLVILGLVGSSLATTALAATTTVQDPSDGCPTETYGDNDPSKCPDFLAGYTPAPRAPGRLAPATGALLGVHSDSSSTGPAESQGIVDLEKAIGRTLDIDNHYIGEFGYFLKSSSPFEYKPVIPLMDYDKAANRIPLVGWGCGDSHDIAAGKQDDEIKAAALAFKDYGREFFMRYCWEMDGSRQSPSLIGSPAEFIAAWRYIYNIFQQVGATNVIFNYSVNAKTFKSPNDRGDFSWDFYPGDDVVEWVSVDGYNWHGAVGRSDRYRNFLEIFDEFMVWARSTGPAPNDKDPDFPAVFPNKHEVKPIMIAEYGTQEQSDGGAAKARWFQNAHDTVMARTDATPADCKYCGAYSDIAAMVYFDVKGKSGDSEGGWDIQTTAPSLAGYKASTDNPWFKQIQTLTWGPYTGPPAPPPGPDPTPGPTPPPTQTPGAVKGAGYWMLGEDGKVYSFGDAKGHGDAPLAAGNATAADVEPTPTGNGYWVVDSAGHVFGYGDAAHFGGVEASVLTAGEKVTSLSSTPTGKGYWIFTTKGRAIAFGDAGFFGDMSKATLNGPVLDSIPTPTGLGYYMVASDGGIFAFGDAKFFGSMGGKKLNAPVQSLVPDPDQTGYWLVASDGGVFAFEASFRGSMGDRKLNKPVTGMVPFGNGYLMVGEDGGIFNFSDKAFMGSLGNTPPSRPIVSVAPLDT